jgi:uncharacterized protein (TIGR02270 family)
MTKPGYPPCLLDVVEEHFEELDFLWEQREGVVFAPDWTIEDLAELEERAEAHLDGLRLAERHAVDLARPFLAGEETFAATAATFVLMEAADPALADEVLDALETGATPEARDGIRIGLRHVGIGAVRERLVRTASHDDPALAIAAADVLTFQRAAEVEVQRLTRAADPAVRRLAFEAWGRLGTFDDVRHLRSLLADDEESIAVQGAALAAAALSGLRGLEPLCRDTALDSERPSVAALRFLGVFGNAVDLPLLEAAAADAECGAAALAALGTLGRVQAVPGLIDRMASDEPHVTEAAEAFRRITGLEDVPMRERAANRPEEPAARDATGPVDPEDSEPEPDVDALRTWWDAHRDGYDEGVRWKDGVAVSGAPDASWVGRLSLASWQELQWAEAVAGSARPAELGRRVRDRV